MEIKCNVCGTVNDSSDKFCKGCCQLLEQNNSEDNIVINNYYKNDESFTDKKMVEQNDYVIKGSICLYFRFIFFWILCLIAFTFLNSFLIGIFNIENQNIIAIINISFEIIIIVESIKLTFNKTIPESKKTPYLLLFIFLTIFLFQVIFRCANLYYNEIYNMYYYCILFIAVLIVCMILFNYTKYLIDKIRGEKDDSRVVFIANIVTLIIIFTLIIFGINFKKNDTMLIEMEEVKRQNGDYIDDAYMFIDNVEKDLAIKMLNSSEDEIPKVINDPNFVDYNGYKPDRVNLIIDSDYMVSSGEISYNDITYIYDGEKLTKK